MYDWSQRYDRLDRTMKGPSFFYHIKMTEVETVGEEEETNLEVEVWEDNITTREEILNATANLLKDLDDYIRNLEIPSTDLTSVEWDDPNDFIAQTAVTINATKYIYNTKKYRLEFLVVKGQALHETYLEQYYDVINESTDASAFVLAEYAALWNQYLATNPIEEEQTT